MLQTVKKTEYSQCGAVDSCQYIHSRDEDKICCLNCGHEAMLTMIPPRTQTNNLDAEELTVDYFEDKIVLTPKKYVNVF